MAGQKVSHPRRAHPLTIPPAVALAIQIDPHFSLPSASYTNS
jgi:hypothetical protein